MDLAKKKCVACEAGSPALPSEQEDFYGSRISGWEINRDKTHKISKTFKCPSFVQAMDFVDKIGKIAEEEGHHPDIHILYNMVTIELYTHAVGGLSPNDFILAAKIDALKK
jgi:4a-hydroxytetrahydrobiopterin dehydratase